MDSKNPVLENAMQVTINKTSAVVNYIDSQLQKCRIRPKVKQIKANTTVKLYNRIVLTSITEVYMYSTKLGIVIVISAGRAVC